MINWNVLPREARRVKVVAEGSILDKVVAAHAQVSGKQVEPDDDVIFDLSFDSVDNLEVQMAIEEMFGIDGDIMDEFWNQRGIDWRTNGSYHVTPRIIAEHLSGILATHNQSGA